MTADRDLMSLIASMAGLYAKTQTDPLYRWASSLGPYVTHRFWGPHDKRWWDFNVESDALPEAKETKYDCDAKLGSPASDTCEGALIKLRGEQPPTISPGKPIIRTYRGCAISVRSDKEVTTTWDMVASVASHLIETCLAVPFGAKGGRATSQSCVRPLRPGSLTQRHLQVLSLPRK